jgi:hypothetical protein
MPFHGEQVVLAIVAVVSTITFGQSKPDVSPKSVYLSGRLIDSKGTPIANATVTLRLMGAKSDFSTQRTTSNGRFVFQANPKRAHTLRFVAPGFETVILPVSAKTVDDELKDVVAVATASPVNARGQSDVLPSDLLKRVKDDLDYPGVQDCITGSGEVFEQMIRTERLNLAARTQALLVEGLGPCFAGANNGQLLIYIRFGDQWRNVFDESGSQIETLSSRTLRFQDIARWQHDSAFASVRYTYHFDGNSYRVVGCDSVQFSDWETGNKYPAPRFDSCSWNWKQSKR